MPRPEPPAPDAVDFRPAVVIFRSALFNDSETFVQAHAAGLVRYRPLLVGLEDRGNAWPELRDRLAPASAATALRLRWLGDAGPLAARLGGHAPVLVHAHFGTDGLRALPLARALGVPLVTSLHGYDVGRSRGRLLASGRLGWIRYALRRHSLFDQGALFLAVSEAVRRRALALGFPSDRTRTHYLGVDLGLFRPQPDQAEPGLVLHVGRLVEKKGTRRLLDAFARVRASAPAARLVVIGDGPERPALGRRAAALGLGEHVRFLGARPRAEVADWLVRAWAIAVPSVTARDGDAEGLPTVLVEAAAAGVPAVGSTHAGIPEAIADGATGFVVPEGDADALAARLGDLLAAGRPRRDVMGAAARTLAEQRFDAVRQTARLEGIYDEVRGQIRSRRSR